MTCQLCQCYSGRDLLLPSVLMLEVEGKDIGADVITLWLSWGIAATGVAVFLWVEWERNGENRTARIAPEGLNGRAG